MKKILVAVAFLFLAGCSSSTITDKLSNIVNPQTKWVTQSGVPTNGNSVDFTENGPPWVNYLTKKIQGIPAGSAISITYTVTTTGNPVFDYRTKADNVCGKGSPGTVRLFFQRFGDNFSGDGPYQQYRYWSQVAFKELTPGTFTLTATLDPSKWSDVYGKKGSDYPDQFAMAAAYAENIGVTFGGGCFFGHGVKVTGGTAKFTVDQFIP